jgi:hypothetical protein
MGSYGLFAQAGLELWSSRFPPLKYVGFQHEPLNPAILDSLNVLSHYGDNTMSPLLEVPFSILHKNLRIIKSFTQCHIK